MFFKLAEAGEDRVSFPHSSFFKTFIFFILFINFFFFFLQNTISVPTSSLQYRSRSPSGGVGVGSGVGVLVQESAGRRGGERV